MRASATVYRNDKLTIGMTIEGTASLTLTELNQLIDYLIDVGNHARHPDKYSEPTPIVS